MPSKRLEKRFAQTASALDALRSEVDTPHHARDRVRFATEALGLELDPWQVAILASDGRRDILNCSRQAGKSTTAAILALHEAMFVPGSVTLLVSPSQRQSSELFRKVTELRERLPTPLELVEDNRLSMAVRGGGRVASLPGSEATVRGFSAVTLLVEDEAAKVDDLLFHSTRPMLATVDGRHILMSTPWGKRGHFWEVWSEQPGWRKTRIPVQDVPRISPEWIEEERRNTPPHIFASEYLCEFIDREDQVFGTEYVLAALTDDFEPFLEGAT